MNHEILLDRPLRSEGAIEGGLCQALVLRALKPMTAGCLRLALPDGSERVFGNPESEISATLRVARPRFFQRCVLFGDVGLGESYVDGDWETDDITAVISWFILNARNCAVQSSSHGILRLLNLFRGWNRLRHLARPNSLRTSRQNIADHYDLGNEFYQLWLDRTMTYSAGLFTKPGESLEDAQTAKYDALCRKLRIAPKDHVLEIGSGWGGFACHAVKRYGCHVTAVTISREQFDFSRARFQREGVAARIDLRLQDYRVINGRFDRIVSIEMMEALGDRYLETYCSKVHELLAHDGVAGFQYITVPDSFYSALKRGVDWIQKHIFPGSLLLSIGRVNQAINRTGDLFLHDLEDLGASYARTLQTWRDNFRRELNGVRRLGFDERFIRKWNYYLSYCEAAFAMRNISVVQAIYTRPNNVRL